MSIPQSHDRKPMTVKLGPTVVRSLLVRRLWLDVLLLAVTFWAAIYRKNWGWLGVGGAILSIHGAWLSTFPALKRFRDDRIDDSMSSPVLAGGLVNMNFMMAEAPN